MVALNFNAQGVAPNAALEPLPSGTYDARIVNSVEKPTKAGDGSYLEIEYQIISPDPALNNRKVFDRLNINNKKSQQAVDIAYATLSAICHVTGRLHITDTAQLHGLPLKVIVAKVARQDQSDQFSNDIKGYKDTNGNDPGASPGGGQPQNGYMQQGQVGQAPPYGQQPYGQQPYGQQPYQGQPQGQPQPQYGGAPSPQPGYDPSHQQGHGSPQNGNPSQPGVGEQHAYNQPYQGQPQGQPYQGQPQGQPQQGASGQPPAWANGGAPPQQPPQGQPQQPQGQPQGGAPASSAAPPWAQPQS